MTFSVSLLVGGLFLVGFLDGVEHRARPLRVDLDLKDLIQQTANVGTRLFGLWPESLDQLRCRAESLRCLGDRVFNFREGFRINDHVCSSLETRAESCSFPDALAPGSVPTEAVIRQHDQEDASL
jgi:hypothetical protein